MTARQLAARAAAALIAVAAASGTSTAGLLPSSVDVTPESGNYRWTYAIVLPTDMKLQAGNFFTVYDFGGLVAGSVVAPDGWTVKVTNTGPTPDRLNPQDDAKIPNLTWTYTGATIPSGQLGLGNFAATSTFDKQGVSFLTARTNRSSDGLSDSNITDTTVPVGSGITPPPVEPPSPPVPGVPEPTTLALAGLGLPVVLGRWLRRRKGN